MNKNLQDVIKSTIIDVKTYYSNEKNPDNIDYRVFARLRNFLIKECYVHEGYITYYNYKALENFGFDVSVFDKLTAKYKKDYAIALNAIANLDIHATIYEKEVIKKDIENFIVENLLKLKENGEF